MTQADSLAQSELSTLVDALPLIGLHVGETIVIKLGGSVGEEGTLMDDIMLLKQLGINPVIVHGGGPQITAMLKKLGVETRFVEGRRFTDEATMEVVHMVLARVNGQFVSYLDAHGIPAMGLTGLDGGLMRARIRDESIGLVGEVEEVDVDLLDNLFEQDYVVVIAPIAAGPESQPLNINGDTAAGAIAAALNADRFILCTDVPGVKGADGQVIPELSKQDALHLIADGTINGGMIPKVEACLGALDNIPSAQILDGRAPRALIRALFTREGAGTTLLAEDA